MNWHRVTMIGVLLVLGGIGLISYFTQVPVAQPGSGPPIARVAVPALSEDELGGLRAYNQYCADCHGENAAGQESVAPPLVDKIYAPGHHANAAFALAARTGVRAHHWNFGDMPPVAGVSEPEIAQIVDYLRALQVANGIE